MSIRTLARAAVNPVATIGVAVVLVGGTGIATAATGGSFVLGRSNSATTQTFLTNPNGPALGLTSKAGTPAFTLGNTVKVPRLNADYLDNLDSAAFQRRIATSCPGGAISAVSATGSVTCATLPRKINSSVALGNTAVGTFDGFTVNVSCTKKEEFEGPRLEAYVYVTGTGILNGHATTTLYSGVDEIDPVGAAIPAAGTGASLPTIDAPDLAFSRQSSTLMAVANGKLTVFALHLFADARNWNGTPCTVWGTAT